MTNAPNDDICRAILDDVVSLGATCTPAQLERIGRSHANRDNPMPTKQRLLDVASSEYGEKPWLRGVLKKKPVRSLSGITSVTILTKPYPCPGKCIFCPVDVRMPKSYIATEPGAQRAGQLGFDPYAQVTTRLRSYAEIGHPISKIELIVLGGTWSAYPKDYQIWFLERAFRALNNFGIRDTNERHAYTTNWGERIAPNITYDAYINSSRFVKEAFVESATLDALLEAQRENETAASRCVGLSLETRPDSVDANECEFLRRLGATKIQIGLQSLDDAVLRANKRGHSVAQSRTALNMLRRFGFKLHAHWMPNLFGSTASQDCDDYDRLFHDVSIRPDELKIYPCSLIQDTELERLASQGKWTAYTDEELHDVLTHVLISTPEYCRLTRVIRDIPSFEILQGNKQGNLRQIVERKIPISHMRDIRAREVKDAKFDNNDFVIEDLTYDTDTSTEHFLQFVRPSDRKLAGFLRLSLPKLPAIVTELHDAAMIREIHVYGQSLNLNDDSEQPQAPQHRGLGKLLHERAAQIAAEHGFLQLAVISAVGTRGYYRKLGFADGELYQFKPLG